MFLKDKLQTLRAVEPEDLAWLYEHENDTALWRFGDTVEPCSRYMLKSYVTNSNKTIFERHDLRLMMQATEGFVVGTVDLYNFEPLHGRAALGLLVDAQRQGQGYGGSALRLIEDYAVGILHLHQLYAYILEQNECCVHLFDKHGYVRTGLLRDWIRTPQGYADTIVFQKHLTMIDQQVR